MPEPRYGGSVLGVRALLRNGYDRRSLDGLVVLSTMYVIVLRTWRDLFDLSTPDPLFLGIWIGMTAILCFRIDAARDVPRAIVGLGGGLAIEAWGTVTELWTYSTHERPPLWIVPAWPVATLAIDRLAAVADVLLPRAADRLARPALAAFVAWMVWFARPSWGSPATWLAALGMVLVVATVKRPRQDVALFVSGAALGVFLEYWGTSRECWTYWTREVPPPVAAAAHGFASVAFQRVVDVAALAWDRLRPITPRRTARRAPLR